MDRQKAGTIRDKLASYRIDVFVAHDDLEGGAEWRKMLINSIKECNVFLMLLTPNFHTANFTEQEAGAAIAFDRPIVPISLNGEKSYGFVTDYQDTKMTDKMQKQDLQKLALNIYRRVCKTPKEAIDLLIQSFELSGSWDQAVKLYNAIATYYDELVQDQVRNIARAFLNNEQIRTSYAAQWVDHLLKQKQHMLGLELKSRVEKLTQSPQVQQDQQDKDDELT